MLNLSEQVEAFILKAEQWWWGSKNVLQQFIKRNITFIFVSCWIFCCKLLAYKIKSWLNWFCVRFIGNFRIKEFVFTIKTFSDLQGLHSESSASISSCHTLLFLFYSWQLHPHHPLSSVHVRTISGSPTLSPLCSAWAVHSWHDSISRKKDFQFLCGLTF